jgi:hypothetical protein
MMVFHELELSKDGIVKAEAEGHATEVLEAFRSVCQILLGNMGPWKISYVNGECLDGEVLDSEMKWKLIAKTKL